MCVYMKVYYDMYQGDPSIDPIADPNQPESVPSNAGASSSSSAAPLSPINSEETIALANLEYHILEIAAQQSIDSLDEDEILCQVLNSSFP